MTNIVTLLRQDVDRWNQWRRSQPAHQCCLAGQDLSHGYFFDADFSGLDLRGVNFERACLIGADFSGADLSDADFSRAYLKDALFDGAQLAGARFDGAHDGPELPKVADPELKIAIANLSNRPTSHRNRPWQMLAEQTSHSR